MSPKSFQSDFKCIQIVYCCLHFSIMFIIHIHIILYCVDPLYKVFNLNTVKIDCLPYVLCEIPVIIADWSQNKTNFGWRTVSIVGSLSSCSNSLTKVLSIYQLKGSDHFDSSAALVNKSNLSPWYSYNFDTFINFTLSFEVFQL